ncbi:hypothetical protein ACFQUU_25225 [Herbaspirillum sp. GCM10030257]|uniref:hypothetical protein n=1 Tax=Herbaspirillum sp. GCM10030257 TaxID=3273393 RepID=UPI003621BE09
MYEKENILDGCMIDLVGKQVPFPVGSKADRIMHSEETNNCSREYDKELVGYQFSWGPMAEAFTPANESKDAGSDERKECLSFEIIPKILLRRCPLPNRLSVVLLILYREHPLCNEDFDVTVGSSSMGLLQLSATGKEPVTDLRLFMCHVFLPTVLPNLLACLEGLIEVRDANPKLFDEICRKAKELESKPLKFHRGSNILYDAIATAS